MQLQLNLEPNWKAIQRSELAENKLKPLTNWQTLKIRLAKAGRLNFVEKTETNEILYLYSGRIILKSRWTKIHASPAGSIQKG